MNRKRAVALLSGGCASVAMAGPGTAFAADTAPIRLASLVSDTAGEPLYGQDSGIFSRAGITVELSLFTNFGAVQGALVSRAVDVGVLDSMGFAVTASRGIPLVAIAAGAVYNTNSPTLLMCVAKTSSLRNPKDLAGKTIAVSTLRGSADLSTRTWLTQQHVDATNIRIIELPFAEMGAALARGTVDAATIAEPSLSVALHAGARPVGKIYDAVAPQYIEQVWAASPDYVQQNPDLVKRFVGSIYEIARWANAHHIESGAILTKYAKLDEADVRNMTRAEYATALEAKLLQPVIDNAAKYGSFPRPVTAAELMWTPPGK